MFSFENVSNQFFAAAVSIFVSAVFMAAAIAPANGGAVLPGVMA
ncbi:hypothetical protein [Erythrobacter sp. HKB08]|nr:hypothetical protein [Erythrobacter sp. HKB08]